MSRAPGRRAPRDLAALRKTVARLSLPGKAGAASGLVLERARKLLDIYLATAEAHGQSFEATAKALRAGVPALRIGGADLEAQATRPGSPVDSAACAAGCAFCCILNGEDGGVILEAEARGVHRALLPLAGAPDGRDWHPRACPALDPATRLCRIYAARPMICRTYLSTDAEACARIAEGVPAAGPGVLGAQGLYLAVQALARAALKGVTQVPTYSLAKVAAAALDGRSETEALTASRQAPRVLEDERARLGGAL
ncbi:Putative zinc-or iron-chelating domain-containing protein [Roseivivax lentus]|uniref:Putative zinc-or iron-chelating domain-containing protein n=1 Tax=Roseivivax lentus TaxID=633194 RepID=A0A1N7L7U6_9RHOB|nr:YkgJ family cysteine cluster protein [Roseivivax lentus]SIS69851.1 Putative zinc-or iron-chelating domain-containing protein [Roseivivax lentus]